MLMLVTADNLVQMFLVGRVLASPPLLMVLVSEAGQMQPRSSFSGKQGRRFWVCTWYFWHLFAL